MLENPIFNPNSAQKGANPALNTAKYQVFKGVKGTVNILGMGVKALFALGRDVIKGIFKSA